VQPSASAILRRYSSRSSGTRRWFSLAAIASLYLIIAQHSGRPNLDIGRRQRLPRPWPKPEERTGIGPKDFTAIVPKPAGTSTEAPARIGAADNTTVCVTTASPPRRSTALLRGIGVTASNETTRLSTSSTHQHRLLGPSTLVSYRRQPPRQPSPIFGGDKKPKSIWMPRL
jgi:hypothetical protein